MHIPTVSRTIAMLALVGLLHPGCGGANAQREVAPGPAPAVAGPTPAVDVDGTVQRILDTILAGRGAHERLVTLCDRHHRIHHEGHLAIEGDGDRSIKVTWPQSFRSIRTGAASRTMSTATPHWLAPTGSSRKKAAV